MTKRKEQYNPNLQDLEEERSLKIGKQKLVIKYYHQPNVVGERNVYNGLPIWVGKTIAKAQYNGKTNEAEAKCWLQEPFTYSRARVVTTGRILKQLNLPTNLSEQVRA